MRNEVQVVGLGPRRMGTSKKGVNYDFIPMSIVFSQEKYEGHRALTVNVQGDDFIRHNIKIGDVLDVVMHEQNFQMVLDAIL